MQAQKGELAQMCREIQSFIDSNTERADQETREMMQAHASRDAERFEEMQSLFEDDKNSERRRHEENARSQSQKNDIDAKGI